MDQRQVPARALQCLTHLALTHHLNQLQDSLELHHKMSGGLSGSSLSLAQRRSRRVSGPVVLQPVPEQPSAADAGAKQQAPAAS